MWNRQKAKARESLDRRAQDLGTPSQFQPPVAGWIRAVRSALGMTTRDLAARLGVSKQRVSELEASELHGGATLKTMRRAAEAMDCVFVYALLPRTTFEEIVERRAREIAIKDLGYLHQTMALEGQAEMGRAAEDQIKDYIEEHLTEKDLWKVQ